MNENLIVSLKDIVVEFDGQKVLDGLSLDIHDKEFVTFLGPSGCGKSDDPACDCRLCNTEIGQCLFDGKDIANMPPYKRPVNTVFQKYALFPHLNVFENVAFGLRLKKMTEDEIRPKVLEMLEIVGLKGFERRSIYQLSGGQQQRVAIARALANNPSIMLCDEATSALDSTTTAQILDLLRRINRELNVTLVIITHSLSVARNICDRVAMIDGGRIVEMGDTEELFSNPQSDILKTLITDAKVENHRHKHDSASSDEQTDSPTKEEVK
mgnify:CR=1 FL=1